MKTRLLALVSIFVCLSLALARPVFSQSGSGNTAAQSSAASASTPIYLARGGTIVLKVPDFGAARQQVIEAAQKQGGGVADARTDVTEKGRRRGWLRLRVAAEKLPDLLATVRTLGTLYADRITTEDLTGEHAELGNRMGRLREHQSRLAGILQTTRKLRGGDILFLQERLFRASVDEDLLGQRRLALERRSRTSSVTIELFEPIPTRTMDKASADLRRHFGESWQFARDVFNRQAQRGVTFAAYLLVFALIWIPALVVGLILLRVAWARSRGLRANVARMWGDLRRAWRAQDVRPAAVPPSALAASSVSLSTPDDDKTVPPPSPLS